MLRRRFESPGEIGVYSQNVLDYCRFDKPRLSTFGIGIDKALGQKNRLGHLAILAAAAALVDKLGAGVPVFGHLMPPARKVRTGKARGLRAAP